MAGGPAVIIPGHGNEHAFHQSGLALGVRRKFPEIFRRAVLGNLFGMKLQGRERGAGCEFFPKFRGEIGHILKTLGPFLIYPLKDLFGGVTGNIPSLEKTREFGLGEIVKMDQFGQADALLLR